jgi:maltooligosyltrehalose trehalohydrolase
VRRPGRPVELLPVNAFNGEHNWGYDGVCWFAPHEAYGGPDGLKRFVDACHGAASAWCSTWSTTTSARRGVRAACSALPAAPAQHRGALAEPRRAGLRRGRRLHRRQRAGWLRDYHVDGLRLDAVHALSTDGATPLLEELAVEVDALSTPLGRPLSLIAESDLNDPG